VGVEKLLQEVLSSNNSNVGDRFQQVDFVNFQECMQARSLKGLVRDVPASEVIPLLLFPGTNHGFCRGEVFLPQNGREA